MLKEVNLDSIYSGPTSLTKTETATEKSMDDKNSRSNQSTILENPFGIILIILQVSPGSLLALCLT